MFQLAGGRPDGWTGAKQKTLTTGAATGAGTAWAPARLQLAGWEEAGSGKTVEAQPLQKPNKWLGTYCIICWEKWNPSSRKINVTWSFNFDLHYLQFKLLLACWRVLPLSLSQFLVETYAAESRREVLWWNFDWPLQGTEKEPGPHDSSEATTAGSFAEEMSRSHLNTNIAFLFGTWSCRTNIMWGWSFGKIKCSTR